MMRLAVSCLLWILALCESVYGAWALQLMWGWFVTPVFGLAAPSLLLMLGLDTFVTLLMPVSTSLRDEADRALTQAEAEAGETIDGSTRGYARSSIMTLVSGARTTLLLGLAFGLHLLGGGA